MRVALYGAICIPIWLALRDEPGLDAHLFVDRENELLSTAYRMLVDDPDPRLHIGQWQAKRDLLNPARAGLTRHWRDFDVLIVSELGPVFAAHTGRYWCFLPSGGDLTVRPFAWRSRRLRHGLRQHASAAVLARLQRRAIRAAPEIWAAPWPPYLTALRRLRVAEDRRRPEYFPIGTDSALFRLGSATPAEARTRLPLPVEADEFVLFHPSRLMMRADRFAVETGQWKRNEAAIEALALLRGKELPRRPVLVLIDQRYSPDRALARRLIGERGLEDHVRWVRPPAGAGFDWTQMRDLYVQSDVVLDDFGVGWFGSVVVEALALGLPVITHVDAATMDQLYPWHPLLLAREPHEIAAHVERLIGEPAQGPTWTDGPRWVAEFHSADAVAKRYSSALSTLRH